MYSIKIYQVVDVRTGIPFYVGSTTRTLRDRRTDLRCKGSCRGNHRAREIISEGGDIELEILEAVTPQLRSERERWWMNRLREQGHPIVNVEWEPALNVGGYRLSEETKRRQSSCRIGDKNPMAGKDFTEEHRQRISESQKKFSATPEGRRARSKAARIRWNKKS